MSNLHLFPCIVPWIIHYGKVGSNMMGHLYNRSLGSGYHVLVSVVAATTEEGAVRPDVNFSTAAR